MFFKGSPPNTFKSALVRCFFFLAVVIPLIGCGYGRTSAVHYELATSGYSQDQETLTKIALKSKDMVARRAAVKSLSNQKALSQIALKAPEKEIRLLAIEKLHDQEVLTGIINDPRMKDSEILLAAIKNTTDQPTLGDVVLGLGRWESEDYDSDRVLAAIENSTNQATLAQVTLGQGRWSNLYGTEEMKAAALNTTDPEILAQIALGRGTWHDLMKQKNPHTVWIMSTRMTIIERINDEAVLLKVALDDKEVDLRNGATARLSHQSSWQKVIENLKHASGHRSTQAAIAELYMFVHDPTIQSHLPGLKVEYDVEVSSQDYSRLGGTRISHTVRGESISITVSHSEEVLGTWDLKTDYPYSLPNKETVFIPASFDIIADIVHSICDRSSLSEEELATLEKDFPHNLIRLYIRKYISLL